MRTKGAMAAVDRADGAQADDGRRTAATFLPTDRDGRIHRAIDLIAALVAHAEAARRWGAVGGVESKVGGLTRWLVASALRASDQVKTPGSLDENGAFALRCRDSMHPLRAGADRLLARMRDRGERGPGLQDAVQIVAIVRRLERQMASPSGLER